MNVSSFARSRLALGSARDDFFTSSQFDQMTKGRTETRERVSVGILRRYGFADGDDVVLHVQSGLDATAQGDGEVDAVELGKALMAFLHRRADQGEA